MLHQLTIAIPTFNRPEKIASQIRSLSKELSGIEDRVKILIIDNHSTLPVEGIFEEINPSNSGSFTLIRNRCNIGGNANIARCFEMCDTPWMWLLSDDDSIIPGSILKACSIIQSYSDAFWVNFRDPDWIPSTSFPNGPIQCFGTNDIDKILNFSNTLFMSNSIFCVEKMKHTISAGYQYATTSAPHLCIAFEAISATGLWIQHDDVVVKREVPQGGDTFPTLPVAYGLPMLANLPSFSKCHKKYLKILLIQCKNFFNARNIIFSAEKAAYANKTPSSKYAVFQIWSRLGFPISPSWVTLLFLSNFRIVVSLYLKSQGKMHTEKINEQYSRQ